MSHPNDSQLTEEIRSMVARIAAVQTEEGLSDGEMLRRYPDLGSDKTWAGRLKTGNFADLNLDRQRAKLSRVCVILDGGLPDEEFHPELPFAAEFRARLDKLERQTSDRRIMVVLAPNGTGKTLTARWACNQARSRRAMVRLRPTWRNKSINIAAGIIRALGEEPADNNPAKTEDHAIRLLRQTPRTLFLDQAHEGGVAVMHLLRAFVDETPSRFVWLGYSTAYRAVITASTDAMIEAQAWLGRCMKPVFDLYSQGTRPADVKFLLGRAGLKAPAAESLAAELCPVLNAHTNLRLLEDALARARAADGNDDPAPATIKAAVTELSGLQVSRKEAA